MNRGDFVELAVTVLYSVVTTGTAILVMGALATAGFGRLVVLPAMLVVGLGLAVLGGVVLDRWRD